VATKLAILDYPGRVTVIRAWLADELEDSDRFASECEAWFGQPIVTLADWKYKASAQNVFRAKRYIKGRYGAPCRQVLKRDITDALTLPDDIYVLGFTSEEEDRVSDFIGANNSRKIICPLIERGLSKADCLAMVERVPIELPEMYRRGYNNNNCRTCPKGGEGYFNHQRVDFPEYYESLAKLQDELGPGSYLFRDRKTGERLSLRNLPPDKGRHDEPDISCSMFCMLAEDELGTANEQPTGPQANAGGKTE
jgi:hypothetical protein